MCDLVFFDVIVWHCNCTVIDSARVGAFETV